MPVTIAPMTMRDDERMPYSLGKGNSIHLDTLLHISVMSIGVTQKLEKPPRKQDRVGEKMVT